VRLAGRRRLVAASTSPLKSYGRTAGLSPDRQPRPPSPPTADPAYNQLYKESAFLSKFGMCNREKVMQRFVYVAVQFSIQFLASISITPTVCLQFFKNEINISCSSDIFDLALSSNI